MRLNNLFDKNQMSPLFLVYSKLTFRRIFSKNLLHAFLPISNLILMTV